MMNLLGGFGLLALTAGMALPAHAEKVLYINLAQDVRYSVNGQDSRIALDLEAGLFGYGHDFGKLAACSGNSSNCVVADFMAMLALPDGVVEGKEYVVGARRFSVSRKLELSFAGCRHEVYRVDVSKNGKRSNSYLFNAQRGVLAIIVPNFGSKEIPESVFLLQGQRGVFGNAAM